MKNRSKIAFMALITSVVFSFSGSPAFAYDSGVHSGQALLPETAKNRLATGNTDDNSINDLFAATSSSDIVKKTHSYDVQTSINIARSEVGTSRATGWSQPGECIMSASRWVTAGGGHWHNGGGARSTYAGASRHTMNEALPGDIIQYESIYSPDSYSAGVHTMLVAGRNADGTFDIIQSNIPYGSGLVTEVKNWKPAPPAGFQAVAWRF